MLRTSVLLSALILSGLAGVAHASLIGDTIDGEYLVFDAGSNHFDQDSAMVGDDPEFIFDISVQSLVLRAEYDFDAESLWILFEINNQLDANLALTAHTTRFTDLDWLDDMGNPIAGEIVGLNLVSGTAPELSSFDFTADGLTFEWDAIFVNSGVARTIMLHFDIIVDHGDTPAIPEPATMTLLGLGLAGIAYVRRRPA